jgi:hypothetical protein
MNKHLTVDEFLADLSKDRKDQVETLRTIIKASNPDLTEHIKWNSPSYVFDGEDRITFNMHYPDQTMILLHMGATRKEDKKAEPIMNDASGMIKWNSNIRGTLSFKSVDEIINAQETIKELITKWLRIEN